MFLFLLLVLQPGLRAGEASLWFGDGLGALALYTSATSDPLFIMYLSVYLPPSVCVCLRALELQGFGSRVGCSQLRSVASMLAGTGDFPGVRHRGSHVQTHTLTQPHMHSHRDTCTPTHTRARSSLSPSLFCLLQILFLRTADGLTSTLS